MKITLKAHIAGHREIAKMFVGCECEISMHRGNGETTTSTLIGLIEKFEYFKVTNYIEDFNRDEITIDTSKAEMDLRLAIGTNIEFVDGKNGTGYLYSINRNLKTYTTFVDTNIYTARWVVPTFEIQLSKDYLERIGVEYED